MMPPKLQPDGMLNLTVNSVISMMDRHWYHPGRFQVLMKILDGSQINEKAQEQFEDLYQSVVLKFNEIFEGKSTALQLRSAVEELFVRSR